MAGSVDIIKFDEKRLINQYKRQLANNDLYDAMNTYNRLRDLFLVEESKNKGGQIFKLEKSLREYNLSDLNLSKTYIYSVIENKCYEIDCLLKILSDDTFFKYNPFAVINKISLFFSMYYEQDAYNYYLNLLKNRGGPFANLDEYDEKNEIPNSKGIHFVDDNGFYIMSEAVKEMSFGRIDNAIKIAGEVEEEDKNYVHTQNFLASMYILKMDYDKAKEVLFCMIDKNISDEETIKIISGLPNLTEDEMNKLILTIEQINDGKIEELTNLEASLLLKIGDTERSLRKLEKITGVEKYSDNYLKMIIKAYALSGDKENLKKYLKIFCTLFPNMPIARLATIKLENGEDFDCLEYLITTPTKSIKKEIRTYLLKILKKHKSFDSVTAEESIFFFKLAESIRDYHILKRIINKIYNSKNYGLLEDLAVSIFTQPESSQLIFQVVIENRHKADWTFLHFSFLRKQELRYPQIFSCVDNKEKDKLNYLLSCYAQAYSLCVFMNIDVKDIDKKVNPILEKLYSIDLLESDELMQSENIVYILSTCASGGDKEIENSFFDIKDELKKKLLNLI